MKTLGMRHIALNVADAQKTKEFYMNIFDMEVEWEPDPQNVYLTSGSQDNIAIHEVNVENLPDPTRTVDHFGFIMESPAAVDEVFEKVESQNLQVIQKPKQHRDGAYSFYMKDLNGFVIQLIYHPPIVKKSQE